MTVCIAALATDSTLLPLIILVSDRRYTVGGHWTYEPQQTKHYAFNDHVVALISGTASDCLSMCQRTHQWLGTKPDATVEEIANRFAEEFANYRRTEAERGLLAPIGLTLEQLLSDKRIPESRVTALIDELRRWELEDAALIVGIDQHDNSANPNA